MKRHEPYSKTYPFLAKIKERRSLCNLGSKKNTQHIVLDLKDSGLTYDVGDSIGIFPINDPKVVKKTLDSLQASGEEIVQDKQGVEQNLKTFLTKKANITEFSKKFITELAARQPVVEKKIYLESLLKEENKELLRQYHHNHEVWDALKEQQEVSFQLQDLCNLLMPLLPRFYSIASSQLVVGEEVHLTVALTEFETQGIERLGVCTNFLCNICPIGEAIVPVYIQPHHGFTLPLESNADLIMIGPGTGIAPFRAFMQERLHKKHKGKNWLFFGEWTRKHDFFYEEEWTRPVNGGHLKLDLAFSRDQEQKIYVQHRMLENGLEFFQWLEQGAYIFVCGDAKKMAKDVDAAIHEIIKIHGSLDEEGVKGYIKQLKTERRYLRDVY